MRYVPREFEVTHRSPPPLPQLQPRRTQSARPAARDRSETPSWVDRHSRSDERGKNIVNADMCDDQEKEIQYRARIHRNG